jgi:ABC-type bacteriocin/lantibiotic exporter with double-glycine peptidase domain
MKILQGKLLVFPKVIQVEKYSCGSACLRSVLKYYGFNTYEKNLIKKLGTNKIYGTKPSEIIDLATSYNLKVRHGSVSIRIVKRLIDERVPPIVILQAWTTSGNTNYLTDWKDGHYSVLVGYLGDYLFFSDPSVHENKLSYLHVSQFADRWHDEGIKGKKYKNYTIAIYGATPKYRSKDLKIREDKLDDLLYQMVELE